MCRAAQFGGGQGEGKEERKRSSWQAAEIGAGLGPLAHSLVKQLGEVIIGLWVGMRRKGKVPSPVSKIHTKREIPKAVLGTLGKMLLSLDGLRSLFAEMLLLLLAE